MATQDAPIRPEFIDDERASPGGRIGLAALETVVIWCAFFLHGASLPPDVNEVHYLGKAKHYWDPDWCRGDFFLETADAHQAFYWSFGWLTLPQFELSLAAVAWIGRAVTWLLMAAAWRRLSWGIVARPFIAVISSVAFLALVQRGHMAGEWIAGGVEAKGFAYACVLFGLGSLVRGGWRAAMVWCGVGAAFHVLVGGWALVAIAVAWVLARPRPAALRLVPAALVALALAAPGVWFALALDRGADPDLVRQANFIYVYERLGHHLTLEKIDPTFVVRFVILSGMFVALARSTRGTQGARTLATFVIGALLLALVGTLLSLIGMLQPNWAAPILRFYWFRLADIAVPLGVALLLAARIDDVHDLVPRRANAWAAVAVALCLVHLGVLLYDRRPGGDFWVIAPADAKLRIPLDDGSTRIAADDWKGACRFLASYPPSTKCLTPRAAHTFKWYAGLPEVGVWKDLPQDALGIIAWYERMDTIHSNRDKEFPERRWARSLSTLDKKELVRVAQKYGAQIVVTEATPRLNLPQLYSNKSYAVYEIPREPPR